MSVDAVGESAEFDNLSAKEEVTSTWNGRDVRVRRLDDEALLVRTLAFMHLVAQQEGWPAVRKLEQDIYALGASRINEEVKGEDIDDPEIEDFLARIDSTADWTSPEFLKIEERVRLLLNDPTRPCNPLILHKGLFSKVAKVVRHAGRDVRHFCDEHKKPLIVIAAVAVAVTTIALTAGAATPQAVAGVAAAAAVPSNRSKKEEEEEKKTPPQSAASPPPPKNTNSINIVFPEIPSFAQPPLPSSSIQPSFPTGPSPSMVTTLPSSHVVDPNLFTSPACHLRQPDLPPPRSLLFAAQPPASPQGFAVVDVPLPSSLSLPGKMPSILPPILPSQTPTLVHPSKEPASSKAICFIDPDAPPRVYPTDPPAPPPPKTFTIPGKTLARGAIGGINGIGNDLAQATVNAKYVAELSGGHQIQWVYNKTYTIAIDLLDAFFLNGAGHSASVQELVEKWTAFHKQFENDSGAKLLQNCHSQGASHVRDALMEVPKEIRDRVIVLAIAPAVVVPKELCFDSFNYASKKDFIPQMGKMNQYNDGMYPIYPVDPDVGHFQELILLEPHPDAPHFDHAFNSPTFVEVIRKHLTDYINQYGEAQ